MESDFAELCMAIADGTLADWGVAEDARSAAPAEGGAAINASAKNNGRENAPPFIDFIKWKSGAVCAPVAVAGGYPGEYKKGAPIAFNETAFAKTGAALFVAGATRSPGGPAGSGLRTAGGRVLACSAYGADAEEARKKAYAALAAVNFDGMDYRRDIGQA
jgi:phosphoribosylamine-glycine ligase